MVWKAGCRIMKLLDCSSGWKSESLCRLQQCSKSFYLYSFLRKDDTLCHPSFQRGLMRINQKEYALKMKSVKYELAFIKFQNIFQVYVTFIGYSMNRAYCELQFWILDFWNIIAPLAFDNCQFDFDTAVVAKENDPDLVRSGTNVSAVFAPQLSICTLDVWHTPGKGMVCFMRSSLQEKFWLLDFPLYASVKKRWHYIKFKCAVFP